MRDTRALHDAAVARAAGVAARADRPSQRRNHETGTAPGRASAQIRNLQLRAAGDTGGLHYTGLATVYERGYEMWDMWGPYTEIVSAGAGATSLATPNLDVPLVLQHADLRRIARTTNGSLILSETDDGLLVDAPSLDQADADVAYIVPKLRAGLIDEMSFKFRITSGQWSPDYTEYRINGYDLHRGDVAIVGYGANPETTAAMRTPQDPAALLAGLSEADARALFEQLRGRFSPTDSRALITEEDTRPRVLTF